MKKGFLTLILIVSFASTAFAQARGALTNVFASYVSVNNNTNATITFPANSRDLFILNDSGQKICVAPDGGTIALTPSGYCVNSTNGNKIFQMATGTQLYLADYVTGSVSFRNTGGTAASPISVVVTY